MRVAKVNGFVFNAGPWDTFHGRDGAMTEILQRDGTRDESLVGYVLVESRNKRQREIDANTANLIAAAPEMLDILVDIRRDCDHWVACGGGPDVEHLVIIVNSINEIFKRLHPQVTPDAPTDSQR